MIFDIEYWNQGGRIMQRKIYMANQGQLQIESKPLSSKPIDRKMEAAGDYEEEETVPF